MTTHAATQVAAAQEQLDTAAAAVVKVRERIAGGDTKISAAALLAAESAERFAELRLHAAEERAREQAEAAQREEQDRLRDRLGYLETERREEIAQRLKQAQDALADALAEAMAFNIELAEVVQQVRPHPNGLRERSEAHVMPVAQTLGTLIEVLGGLDGHVQPVSLDLNDARHKALSWRA